MGFLYSVLGFLVAIGVLVAVHEFGHFWVARKLGVKVLRFSVGFGRPLWKRVAGEDQTEYVIAAIPLGGYVKMLGEGSAAEPVDPAESHRAFDNQPIWKRTLIVAAGPGINFLFAIIIFWMLGMMPRESLVPVLGEIPTESAMAQAGAEPGANLLSIDGKRLDYFGQHDLYIFNQVLKKRDITVEYAPLGQAPREVVLDVADIPIYNINPRVLVRSLGLLPPQPEITTQLSNIIADSPAATAGLQVGDRITRIDQQPIESWQDLVSIVSTSPAHLLNLGVERDGRLLELQARPESVDGPEGAVGRLGIMPKVEPYAESMRLDVKRGPIEAIGYGVEQTWLMSSVTLRMFWKMITLQVSHKNINGPITIAEVTGQALQVGLDYYLYVLAIVSISLGVMNLLPIPMLDGGHLLMYLIEFTAGSKAAEKAFAVGQHVGILLLVGLMSLAFYNDIFRLLN